MKDINGRRHPDKGNQEGGKDLGEGASSRNGRDPLRGTALNSRAERKRSSFDVPSEETNSICGDRVEDARKGLRKGNG